MRKISWVMLGVCIGIVSFFVGALIYTIFGPGGEENQLPYKISATIKLLGMGILCSSMVCGGIIIEDKTTRFYLFILGFILLIIYLSASPLLEWRESYTARPTALGIPGFEAILTIIGILLVLLMKNMSFKRRILIGIILIVYICNLLIAYQAIIGRGPPYWIGCDIDTSRAGVVAMQRFTAALFVFPILTFFLHRRGLVYTFATLTIVFSVLINPSIIFWFYMVPYMIILVPYIIIRDRSLLSISVLHDPYAWAVCTIICLIIVIIATRRWDKKEK